MIMNVLYNIMLLVLRHGEATALQIKAGKMELDPHCTGKHWMLHPDIPSKEDTRP